MDLEKIEGWFSQEELLVQLRQESNLSTTGLHNVAVERCNLSRLAERILTGETGILDKGLFVITCS